MEGARVIATDIDERKLEGLQQEGVAECLALDVRDTAAVEAVAKRLSPINILFNAAGFVHHGSVLDCTDAEWDFAFDLNVRSMHRTIKAFLPAMLENGGGSIVNIASGAGSIAAGTACAAARPAGRMNPSRSADAARRQRRGARLPDTCRPDRGGTRAGALAGLRMRPRTRIDTPPTNRSPSAERTAPTACGNEEPGGNGGN